MRVIAGRFRGRNLEPPTGHNTRPFTDRVKETVFNIVGHRLLTPGALPDIQVLDVFAGTGAMGIEALSRGAAGCTFVERDRRALRGLRENIRRVGMTPACTVLTDNAWTMRPPEIDGGFGLVFLDPPYRDSRDALRVYDLLERLGPALSPAGVLLLRVERSSDFADEQVRGLTVLDTRQIARMVLVLMARPEATEPADDNVDEATEG